MDRGKEALAEALLEPGRIWRHWSLAIIHHAAGRKGESDQELDGLIAEFEHNGKFQIAEVYSMRGETDMAFEMLERSIEERDSGRSFAKVSPFLKTSLQRPTLAAVVKENRFSGVDRIASTRDSSITRKPPDDDRRRVLLSTNWCKLRVKYRS